MITSEDQTRIALQPETEVEQSILSELFTRLSNLGEQPPHPEKIGTKQVFYTLDIPEYSLLDEDLWDEAECSVDENGKLDPEPGSRALVIVHSNPAHEGNRAGEETEQGNEADTEPEASEDDGDDGGYSEDRDEVLEEAQALVGAYHDDDAEGPAYADLQECAKAASTLGYDIPANQSTEDLVDELDLLIESVTEADLTEEADV